MLALYHNDMSLCAQKVRVCLAEKGLPWENRHLVLRKGEHQQEWYRELNRRANPVRQVLKRAVGGCLDLTAHNFEQATTARQVEAFLAGAARIEEQPVAKRGQARLVSMAENHHARRLVKGGEKLLAPLRRSSPGQRGV